MLGLECGWTREIVTVFFSPGDLIASESPEVSPVGPSVLDVATIFGRLARAHLKDLVIFDHLLK